jgi:hypothetical protein
MHGIAVMELTSMWEVTGLDGVLATVAKDIFWSFSLIPSENWNHFLKYTMNTFFSNAF